MLYERAEVSLVDCAFSARLERKQLKYVQALSSKQLLLSNRLSSRMALEGC